MVQVSTLFPEQYTFRLVRNGHRITAAQKAITRKTASSRSLAILCPSIGFLSQTNAAFEARYLIDICDPTFKWKEGHELRELGSLENGELESARQRAVQLWREDEPIRNLDAGKLCFPYFWEVPCITVEGNFA